MVTHWNQGKWLPLWNCNFLMHFYPYHIHLSCRMISCGFYWLWFNIGLAIVWCHQATTIAWSNVVPISVMQYGVKESQWVEWNDFREYLSWILFYEVLSMVCTLLWYHLCHHIYQMATRHHMNETQSECNEAYGYNHMKPNPFSYWSCRWWQNPSSI